MWNASKGLLLTSLEVLTFFVYLTAQGCSISAGVNAEAALGASNGSACADGLPDLAAKPVFLVHVDYERLFDEVVDHRALLKLSDPDIAILSAAKEGIRTSPREFVPAAQSNLESVDNLTPDFAYASGDISFNDAPTYVYSPDVFRILLRYLKLINAEAQTHIGGYYTPKDALVQRFDRPTWEPRLQVLKERYGTALRSMSNELRTALDINKRIASGELTQRTVSPLLSVGRWATTTTEAEAIAELITMLYAIEVSVVRRPIGQGLSKDQASGLFLRLGNEASVIGAPEDDHVGHSHPLGLSMSGDLLVTEGLSVGLALTDSGNVEFAGGDLHSLGVKGASVENMIVPGGAVPISVPWGREVLIRTHLGRIKMALPVVH